MKKLHAKIGNEWKPVFCRGRGLGDKSELVTTQTKSKALSPDALPYFQRHFPGER